MSGPGSRTVAFNAPFSPSSSYKESISNGAATLESQANKEKEKQKEKEKEIRKIITACGFPSDPIPTSSFNFARNFLSHFGFLSLDSLSRFYLIEDNARFRRSLKDLDKIAG